MLKRLYRSAPLELELPAPHSGRILSVTNSLCYISGLSAEKSGCVFEAAGVKWWVLALLRSQVIALKLSQRLPQPGAKLEAVPSKWTEPGGSGTLGKVLSTFSEEGGDLDVVEFLETKAPLRSWSSNEQLLTGYVTIDFFSPLMVGQNIIFKGKKNSGKFEVLLNTAKTFLSKENSAVVVALVNPARKSSEVLARLGSEAVVYSNSVTDSDASQALLAVTALANAVALRKEGKRVLLVVDDIQYLHAKEQACFAELGYTPYNFQSLAYEHTKSSQSAASLTTAQVFHDHPEFPQSLKISVESLAQRIINFSGSSLPALELINTHDRVTSSVLPAVFAEFQESLRSVLEKVREQKEAEDWKEKIGLYTEPWEKYLLLDSELFLPLFQHSLPLSQFQQLLWLRFLTYSIEQELISTIKLAANQLPTKFFEFATQRPGIKLLKRDFLKLDAVESQKAYKDLDLKVNKPFYDELRRDGLLKPYREDYEHLMFGGKEATLEKLSKGEIAPPPRQILKSTMDGYFGSKKS